ncbi:MAG: tRNA pseudouridine(13) synthase TruD [Pseudomonadales bacterium]|nr:tRNA pseudouridine(13) synthase TruD [Pseudomonadales bacterium]
MTAAQVDIKTKSADWLVAELGLPEPRPLVADSIPNAEGSLTLAEGSLPAEGSNPPAHSGFYVEKVNLNTLDVVRALSRAIGVPQHEIGYAGRKDKWAITRQWFSAPRAEVWPEIPGTRCIEQKPRSKKLRVGELLGNEFTITLRNVQCLSIAQIQAIESGFANRFGSQRVSQDNQDRAVQWLLNRRQRKGVSKTQQGWFLSVVRATLFNKFVAKREALGTLSSAIEGDVLIDGFPSAPLWGRGRSQSKAQAAEVEQLVTGELADICEALEYAGVTQGRRAMFVRPRGLQVESLDENTWMLKFALPPGSYATTLLDEVATVRDFGGQATASDQAIASDQGTQHG